MKGCAGVRGSDMRAIDTNVLVRLIARDELKQVAAAEEFIAKGAWVSHLVLAEATWILGSVYAIKAMEIAKAIEMLLNHSELALQEPEVVSAALDRFRKKPSLGFSDCLLHEAARKSGNLPLGTFDRNLGKLPGAVTLKP
jgi:predicted nucleic-acid-binding protein